MPEIGSGVQVNVHRSVPAEAGIEKPRIERGLGTVAFCLILKIRHSHSRLIHALRRAFSIGWRSVRPTANTLLPPGYNAASFAPFGLPNAAIARGSVFTVFGENLGPTPSQSASSFPLATTLAGVSLSVTQNGIVTQVFPLVVSATQINAVMPSSVTAGVATLRLTYKGNISNAIAIQIANSAPGVFAVANGAGPGLIQNYVASGNQPANSLATPAAPGQAVTIWATGLGPVTFPDNVAPTAGNVATSVTVTIGGQPANVLYSGRESVLFRHRSGQYQRSR